MASHQPNPLVTFKSVTNSTAWKIQQKQYNKMLNLLEVLVIVHLHLKMFPQTVEILYQAFIQKQNKKGGWVGGWGGGGEAFLHVLVISNHQHMQRRHVRTLSVSNCCMLPLPLIVADKPQITEVIKSTEDTKIKSLISDWILIFSKFVFGQITQNILWDIIIYIFEGGGGGGGGRG